MKKIGTVLHGNFSMIPGKDGKLRIAPGKPKSRPAQWKSKTNVRVKRGKR